MSLFDHWEPVQEARGLFGGKTISKQVLSSLADRRKRDPRGRFADEIHSLSAGASTSVGHVKVTRSGDAYAVTRRNGKGREVRSARSPEDAVKKALDLSARDQHPDSVGGRTSFENYEAFARGADHQPLDHEKDLEDRPQEVLGKGSWDADRARIKDLADGDFADTQRMHKPGGQLDEHGEYVGGTYTPERRELHRQIVERHLRGHQPRRRKQILFMGGGGAAGKSTLLRSGAVEKPIDAVLVNPDVVKSMLPEYDEAVKKGHAEDAAAWAHEESSDVAKLIHATAMQLGLNIIVDKTQIKPKDVEVARKKGYSPEGAVATVPIPLAMERAKKRGEKSGRVVKEHHLIEAHQKAARDFPKWVEETGMPITLMETDKGQVIGRASKGKVDVLDQEEFDKFRSRAADHRA